MAAQMADVQARCEQHIPDVLGGDGVLEQALQYAHGHGEAGEWGAACRTPPLAYTTDTVPDPC